MNKLMNEWYYKDIDNLNTPCLIKNIDIYTDVSAARLFHPLPPLSYAFYV